ncbi:hypothetical protein [Maribacter spongiicola]|nr:hypothetical protein [Maribacter spongiicola]
MMLLSIIIPALIVIATIAFTSAKNEKKVRPIKVPVNKRKF